MINLNSLKMFKLSSSVYTWLSIVVEDEDDGNIGLKCMLGFCGWGNGVDRHVWECMGNWGRFK